MAGGCALSGVAESLPTERRQLAGRLRITAMRLLAGLLTFTIFAPETILRGRWRSDIQFAQVAAPLFRTVTCQKEIISTDPNKHTTRINCALQARPDRFEEPTRGGSLDGFPVATNRGFRQRTRKYHVISLD